MEEKQNPKSHEDLTGDTSITWSVLPLDLLISVFERLSFANFRRAKSVCSSWHSASKNIVPKNKIHWLILFPKDKPNNSYTLFNPEEEKGKLYKTQDLCVEFGQSYCLATYGSWLLMRDLLWNQYIVNPFTQERIDLPRAESQLGTTKMKRTKDDHFRITNYNGQEQKELYGIQIRSPVFWIDEKTKDYVVIWGLRNGCVVYSKKGDTSWNQLPKTSDCFCMVYKDHKLYFQSIFSCFKIIDLSGHIPQETFQCSVVIERIEKGRQISHRPPSNSRRLCATKIIVTVTGDVLKVDRFLRERSRIWSFRVYMVCSSGIHKKRELISSLGNEAMLWDEGITVIANGTDGFIRDSIYFSSSYENTQQEISIFNLETQKTEVLHKFDWDSEQFSTAQWFLPTHT